MKNYLIVLIFCSNQIYTAQSWQSAPFYIGGERDDAVGFSINAIGYVGTGRDAGFQYRNDFYRFQDNQWVQIPSIIGIERQYACSFSLNETGCVLTGIAPNDSMLNEMQCFDATNNEWNIKPPFPGMPRLQAVSFSVGNYGFCGLGRNLNTDFNDWYCYNATINQWTSIAPFPVACHESVAFTINGVGYVGLGKSMNGTTFNHFYRYNALTNTWAPIAPFPGEIRSYSIAFCIGEQGYVVTGIDENNSFSNEYWCYHPATNSWEQLDDFPFERKRGVANFVVNNCAHIVTGLDENFQRLNTHQTFCVDIATAPEPIQLYPNPNNGNFVIYNKEANPIEQFSIIDLMGKTVYQSTEQTQYYYISQPHLAVGYYLVKIIFRDQSQMVKGIVISK